MGWIEEHQEREVEKQHKRFYFGDMFTEQLEKWKRINHKTEKEFANAIGVHPNMVTKWKQGKSFPQAANMKSICAEMRIHESTFNPFTNFENDYVKNAGRKEMSRYLQMYADENGFDEEFYAWLIKQPGFVSKFPFHGIEESARWENVIVTGPSEDHPDEKDFPLLKFEFEDDFGHRKMMVKEDIDFILDIQEGAKRYVFPLCIAEKEEVKKQRVEKKIQELAADYHGIDTDEVKRQYYGTDFVQEEFGFETERSLKEIVKELAEKSGIRPRIKASDIWFEFDPKEVAQLFRDQGYGEDKIADMVEEERKGHEYMRKHLVDRYKKEGYIIEEEESDNGQY